MNYKKYISQNISFSLSVSCLISFKLKSILIYKAILPGRVCTLLLSTRLYRKWRTIARPRYVFLADVDNARSFVRV